MRGRLSKDRLSTAMFTGRRVSPLLTNYWRVPPLSTITRRGQERNGAKPTSAHIPLPSPPPEGRAVLYRQLSAISAHGYDRDVVGKLCEYTELAIGRRAVEAQVAPGVHLRRTPDDLGSGTLSASVEVAGHENGVAVFYAKSMRSSNHPLRLWRTMSSRARFRSLASRASTICSCSLKRD